ncbi:hypothetical protein E4T45_02824 [Aureobasidium sp. EXF-8846]|nr:hypothetical protein E4T45_02824 [Aureobasidium sp. EXF-8846]
MDPIIINLSAPIYGSDGTGVVPSTADERIEAPDAVLAALTSAFRRLLARPGPRRGDLIAIFGNDQYEFVGGLPVGYTHVRYTRRGRHDIRIYGHPSGDFYNSTVRFLPHVVALLVRSDLCWCDLCKGQPIGDTRLGRHIER